MTQKILFYQTPLTLSRGELQFGLDQLTREARGQAQLACATLIKKHFLLSSEEVI